MTIRVDHSILLDITRDTGQKRCLFGEDADEAQRILDQNDAQSSNTLAIPASTTETLSFGDVGAPAGLYLEVNQAVNVYLNGSADPIALVPQVATNRNDQVAKLFLEATITQVDVENTNLTEMTGVYAVWGSKEGAGTLPPVSTGSSGGWITVRDVTGRLGVATSLKTFQDVGQTVLQSVTASGETISILVRASYPLVTFDSVQYELVDMGGYYEGTLDVTVPVANAGDLSVQVLDANNNPGAIDTFTLAFDTPPTITAAVFTGGYPTGPGGLQTELKAGDTFQIQVTADEAFDAIELVDDAGNAFVTALDTSFTPGLTATITGTIADRGNVLQSLPALVRVREAATGAFSAQFDTSSAGAVDGVNTVQLNNTVPSIATAAIGYPASQSALKASEQATIGLTVNNADSIASATPLNQLNVTVLNLTNAVVERIAGDYNVSQANLELTATRNANGAQFTVQRTVNIANVAPTITVSTPQARLRSGGNDGTAPQDYAITISSDQELASAPSLDADSGGQRGTFQGGGFTGGPSVWTRSLRVDETVPDEKGTFAFENLVATGLAGIVQNNISSGQNYELGGFVSRDLVVAAFSATVDANVQTVDFSKVQAGAFSPGGQSVKQPIGTPPAVDAERPNEYTIAATGVSPTVVQLLDTAAVNANSLGLYTLNNFEEIV